MNRSEERESSAAAVARKQGHDAWLAGDKEKEEMRGQQKQSTSEKKKRTEKTQHKQEADKRKRL